MQSSTLFGGVVFGKPSILEISYNISQIALCNMSKPWAEVLNWMFNDGQGIPRQLSQSIISP